MSPKPPFSKILIIQTAFIGDVILATSLVEKLSSIYSDAKIDFLLRKGNEGLLIGNPKINKTLIWNKKSKKIRNLIELIVKVREEKYDLVVNLQRFFSSGMLTAFSNGGTTVGFNKNPLSFLFSLKISHKIGKDAGKAHEIERNLLLIRSFTDDLIVKPKLYPSEADYFKTSIYKSDPYICIAPASVWFTKQFPYEKWIEFIKYIPAAFKIYLLGSPHDKELCHTILEKTKGCRVEDLSGRFSFLESAALMEDAHMNYVNDSAPMHIASAMNAPVCAVFCSTVPSFGFGPLSDKAFVVEVKEKLPCRPCGLHGHKACPEKHFKCGFEIKKEQLLAVL